MLPGGAVLADWRWGGAASLHSILEPMASPSPSSHHNCFTCCADLCPVFFSSILTMIYQQSSAFLYKMFSSTQHFDVLRIDQGSAYNIGHLSPKCLIRFLKRESASTGCPKTLDLLEIALIIEVKVGTCNTNIFFFLFCVIVIAKCQYPEPKKITKNKMGPMFWDTL